MLLDAIDDAENHFEKQSEIKDKLIKSYLNSDIDRFYELTKDESKEHQIVFESMFQKRHDVWMPNIIQLMNKYTCFFAVGVAHLSSETGVIELLRQEGYNVEPVK